jgi:hypothetical protein
LSYSTLSNLPSILLPSVHLHCLTKSLPLPFLIIIHYFRNLCSLSLPPSIPPSVPPLHPSLSLSVPQLRTIPLELFYKQDSEPTYGITSDDDNRATEAMTLPFQGTSCAHIILPLPLHSALTCNTFLFSFPHLQRMVLSAWLEATKTRTAAAVSSSS